MSILFLVQSSVDPSVLPVAFLVPASVYLVSLGIRTVYELLKESGGVVEGSILDSWRLVAVPGDLDHGVIR